MKLNEYWQNVETMKKTYPYMRPGQAAFDVLANMRPDLAEKAIYYCIDPFYIHNTNDGAYRRFVAFVKNNWEG
jgi:hypothetical protein